MKSIHALPCHILLLSAHYYTSEFGSIVVVVVKWILFRWHYRTAAAGPPYNVNKISL